MEPITFVIDTQPLDEADFERTRTLVGKAVKELREDGVRVNDELGLGLAIKESREHVLGIFGKSA